LTKAEFKARYLTYVPSGDKPDSVWDPSTADVSAGSPTLQNWAGNLTTPVKDQGQCGSCWAFSATEQVESMAIKARKMTTKDALSVQQIVSCDKNKDEGCNGGDTKTAYRYIIKDKGLEPESAYKYTSGATGMTGWCLGRDQKTKEVDITGYSVVGHLDESVMQKYVQSTGPLSICVDAESWQTYKHGVVTKATCGTQLDHCVQLTGYDFTKYVICGCARACACACLV
jgi:C1A family cysteine protease